MSKIMYATIMLVVNDTGEINDIYQETDYEFKHKDILWTDWREIEEKS